MKNSPGVNARGVMCSFRLPHPDGHPLLTQEEKRILYLLIMIFTTASMSASVIPSLPSSSAFESLKRLD